MLDITNEPLDTAERCHEEHAAADFLFKHHRQFPQLLDIFNRQHQHHIALTLEHPTLCAPLFLHAFAQYLKQPIISLEQVTPASKEQFIISLTGVQLAQQGPLIKQLTTETPHRLLVLMASPQQLLEWPGDFAEITIDPLRETEKLALLENKRQALERYHQLLIPPPVLNCAYKLTHRFLNPQQSLEQTILLLDSSAARAKKHITAKQEIAATHTLQSILTEQTVVETAAEWCQLPASILMRPAIAAKSFIAALQQKIVGQDTALQLIAEQLQYTDYTGLAAYKLYGGFIFAGANHSGKRKVALTLADVLYQQRQAAYCANLSAAGTDLQCLRLQQMATGIYYSLEQILHQHPYAILLLEQVEAAHPQLLADLLAAAQDGQHQVANHQPLHVSHTMMLFSTALGKESLAPLACQMAPGAQEELDLLQLVMMPTPISQEAKLQQNISTQLNIIKQELNQAAPILRHCHFPIIPFFALNQTEIEHILGLDVQCYFKRVEQHLGVDVYYAHEIIPFLAAKLAQSQTEDITTTAIISLLEATVKQACQQREHYPASKQLHIQLNELGQGLQYQWLNYQKPYATLAQD